MSGMGLGVLHTLSASLTSTHFTNEQTEARKHQVTYLESYGCLAEVLGFQPRTTEL